MTGENIPPVLTVAGSHSLCPVFTDSCNPQKWKLGAITVPITQMKKPRSRQVTSLRFDPWNLNLSSFTLETGLVTPVNLSLIYSNVRAGKCRGEHNLLSWDWREG